MKISVSSLGGAGEIGMNMYIYETDRYAVIVDCASEFGIESWSVDTRAWKSSILGTSKPCVKVYPGVKDPKKILDVEYIVNLGFGKEISIYKGRNKKQFVCYNDDAADSACIALYGFVKEPKLKKEM